MLTTMLAGLRAHRARLVLSSIAIVLGVGFASGSFVLTDTMRSSIYHAFAQDARNATVIVLPPENRDQLPRHVLASVRDATGVAIAEGRVQGAVTLVGKSGRPVAGDGAAGPDGLALVDTVNADRTLRWQDVASGQLPTRANEIAVGADIANADHFALGDRIRVLDENGHWHSYALTGTVDLGNSPAWAGTRYLGLTEPAASNLLGSPGYARIDVRADDEASPAAVRSAVADAVGDNGTAYTGEQYAEHQLANVSSTLTQVRIGLLAFAAIAMFVAAIVIANTFTILVARRTREMALLRCVGATRRQVYVSLLGESALLGAASSAVGVGVGIGIGWVAQLALRAGGVPFPTGPIAVSVLGVVAPLLVGVVVTVAAAAMPAIAATRIAPVAALRNPHESVRRGRPRVVRIVLASIAVFGGVAAMVPGVRGEGGQQEFVLAIAGGGLAFVGVLLATPLLVPNAIRAVGWVVARPFGVPGRLARLNAVRNPGRAASTTAALLVGVTLISIMTVASASLKKTATSALDENFPYDLAVRAQGTGDVPTPVVRALRGDRHFDGVLPVKQTRATLGRARLDVQAVDPDRARAVLGSAGGYAKVAHDRFVLPKALAHRADISTGDAVTLRFRHGHTLAGTVASLSDSDTVIVSTADLNRAVPGVQVGAVYLTVPDSVSAADAQRAAEQAAGDRARLTIGGPLQYKASITNAVDTMVLVFAGLLGISVLIALVGIANTLALSVLERTRESAVLRALGLTRGQLRGMLSGEAMLMSVVAGVVGALLGVAFGMVAVRSLVGSAGGAQIVVPYGLLGAFVALAAVAGLVASLLPASRAARTSMVVAMAEE